MPELPEVETVTRGIEKSLKGLTIKEILVRRPKLRYEIPASLDDIASGAKITKLARRAKYILIYLDNQHIILCHLGMSGKIIIEDNHDDIFSKHDHVIFFFDNGFKLTYNDARRFGMIDIFPVAELENHKHIKNLGVEPLEQEFSSKVLEDICKNKNMPIKQLIMDANKIVGVGNIYANEALFLSNILPTRKSSSLKTPEITKLVDNIKQVLQKAIEAGGSTLKDYVHSDGSLGYFQNQFKCYGRKNLPCFNCNEPIEQIKQGGRSTFYCKNCQS